MVVSTEPPNSRRCSSEMVAFRYWISGACFRTQHGKSHIRHIAIQERNQLWIQRKQLCSSESWLVVVFQSIRVGLAIKFTTIVRDRIRKTIAPR